MAVTIKDGVVTSAMLTAKYEIAPPKDLLIKFGIKEEGYTSHTAANVTAGFNALHEYINDTSKFTATSTKDTSAKVKLGDYIDLVSLTVPASSQWSGWSRTNTDLMEHGKVLRMIVVGINSFNRRTTHPSGYEVTPHVIFQFQNVPGNEGNLDSVYFNNASYGFIKGLTSAGVPSSVIWAPKRWVRGSIVTDQIWGATEREMFGDGPWSRHWLVGVQMGPHSPASGETLANQAWLEYYTGDSLRAKYSPSDVSTDYWVNSTDQYYGVLLYVMGSTQSLGQIDYHHVSGNIGAAPTFAVK
jgi:hypothetical protein